jgi:predicted enzyme related to lactoylglutathione lyase
MYIRADTYPAGVEPLTVWLPSLGFLRIKTGRSSMRVTRRLALTVVFLNLTICFSMLGQGNTSRVSAATATTDVAVGPQYDSTHVYVTPEDFDRFVNSLLATFGGTASKQGVFTVTPTPSSTISQLALTPVGSISVFGFKTPIPYPFGTERTGYLVTDLDAAIDAARADGADVLVSPFNDPIGRDAIIQWPGGVNMQLYWHTTPPAYAVLETIPENRVYVSVGGVTAFMRSFLAFSHGTVVSDELHAPGVEIGRPSDTYRRVRIQSTFGLLTMLVTDGHLPYPYGREITGYEVKNLAETLAKAKAAGVTTLAGPYSSDGRTAAIVQFPGGYIAEIHTLETLHKRAQKQEPMRTALR